MGATDHRIVKRDWERQAIRLFIELYNRSGEGSGYRLLYQQEKPDAVLEEKGPLRRKLGVEITHLFYSQEEAMRVLGHGQPPKERGAESFNHLLDELNLLIRKKIGKRSSYSMAYPIALLVRNASPGFGMSDFLARQSEVQLPDAGVFTHIWFLSRDGGDEWKLLQLV
jgi:hypothetical protein